MNTLTQRQFRKYTLKAVRDEGGIYFVRFYPPDDDAYEFECRYDISRQKLLSSDKEFSDEQMYVIHDEVAEQFSNDCDDDSRHEPDSYEKYGLSESSFF